MLTIGSLFSGIGGLDLGLEWAGLGPTLWQVEISEPCRRVLARHWPEAKRYEDVRSVGAPTLAPVDLICGGFPCQDISSAGKRAGLAGARSGLWYEFARILAECRPRFVVIENVASGAAKWVDAVRGDLERLGYASLPIPIAASDLGAPHQRARVFIVGCAADPHGKERSTLQAPKQRSRVKTAKPAGARAHAADAHHQRQLQPRRVESEGGRWPCDADRCWTAEPDVARVAVRLPGRVDRERMIGNCVVPQCAEVVGHVIRQLMEGAA
jgi:DNA (cytosine-5)-methyltransferase 1